MEDARNYGTVCATVPRVGSGYVREFYSYTVFFEQSNRVLGTGRGDSVHQVPGIVKYK